MNSDRDNKDGNHLNERARGGDLFDFFGVLLESRKLILLNVLVVTAAAVIVSLLLPKWYKSTASILPPKEQGLMSQFGAASSLLKGLAPLQKGAGLLQSQGAYNFVAILKSRSELDSVVRKFDLIKVYDVSDSSMEKAIEELTENVAFEVQDEDYITVQVLDKDPVRAADMANYFVQVLNNISIELGTKEARSNREFIEKRLEMCKSDLRAAEEALRSFQERSGFVMVPEQNMASISAAAELYAMKAKKEVEIGVLQRTATRDNPALQQLDIELSELNKQLKAIPEAGLESFRLYRDVAIQQKIVEFLVPLYEQARLDEQKDVPVILVLDRGIPAERKEKPKRVLLVLLWSLSALALSILWVFVRRAVARAAEGENAGPYLREMRGSALYKKIFRGA